MSAEEQITTPAATGAETLAVASNETKATNVKQEQTEKILQAKELYSQGSRNYLVKNYAEAADELSQVCGIYSELYGDLSDELGMPYLLYAKSLIALAVVENKVIDVPDAEEDDDDDEVDEEVQAETESEANGTKATSSSSRTAIANGNKLDAIEENGDEADSSGDAEKLQKSKEAVVTDAKATGEDSEVSSSGGATVEETVERKNGTVTTDDEKPSTSNGEAIATINDTENVENEDDENDAASSLQLAWEILELAAKIFSRQGLSGLSNLAEVQTELANIEFENSICDAARDDYEKALKIYTELPNNNRRAMAEIHYKIGLTYLMQQMNKEASVSLKNACALIETEIDAIKEKIDTSEKDKNVIKDLEETKREISAKIIEIDEIQAQTVAEVRAALDSYIKPIMSSRSSDAANPSSTSANSSAATSTTANASSYSSPSTVISSSSKPTDISHLIKRKKPEEPSSEAEAACSPAKRTAV